jgi:hypothetical protein
MSDMYRKEVPAYGSLMELVAAVNGATLAAEPDLRERLDAAAAADTSTRAYVERLEGMVDESRLPSGTELISEIERFLRDRGAGSEPRG